MTGLKDQPLCSIIPHISCFGGTVSSAKLDTSCVRRKALRDAIDSARAHSLYVSGLNLPPPVEPGNPPVEAQEEARRMQVLPPAHIMTCLVEQHACPVDAGRLHPGEPSLPADFCGLPSQLQIPALFIHQLVRSSRRVHCKQSPLQFGAVHQFDVGGGLRTTSAAVNPIIANTKKSNINAYGKSHHRL